MRERVSIDLRGLAPRLKSYAAAHGRTPAASIRLVLAQALALASEAESVDVGQHTSSVPVSTSKEMTTQTKAAKVTLRLPADRAGCLARRARASEMSQGAYISALLNGDQPVPLPASHDTAVQALRASTDHLAVLSADLNGFLRSVGHIPHAGLQSYRASIVSVVEDVKEHLAQASALMAEVRATRRGRR